MASQEILGDCAITVEATAKHDGANRSFGVDLTWRTWRVDLAGQLPSAALELPNLRRGCSIGAEGGMLLLEPAGQITQQFPGMVDVDIYLGGVAQEPLSGPEQLTERFLSWPQAINAESRSVLGLSTTHAAHLFRHVFCQVHYGWDRFSALCCRWSCVWFDAKPEGITEFRAFL